MVVALVEDYDDGSDDEWFLGHLSASVVRTLWTSPDAVASAPGNRQPQDDRLT